MKHRITAEILSFALLPGLALLVGCVTSRQQANEDAMVQMEHQTGLKGIQIPNTTNVYLGKTHRGYEIVYSATAGNVWGRYVTRLTLGEIGRESGGLLAFLTGSYKSGVGGVTGSPLDRLLSKIIGQPLSIMILLKHGKPNAPRLDILSGFAVVAPEEKLPPCARIGFKAGSLYSADADFARRIADHRVLMQRMQKMRCEYIRVDQDAVTLLWAGSESDYSGMIGDHGGYYNMINAFMDNLADIADAISPAK